MRPLLNSLGLRALFVLSLGLTAAACGPTQATIMINESEVALEKAKLANADQSAIYEYHSAKEYLHKAKEEWGYSDFERSLEFATLALKFAEEAVLKAKGVRPEDRPNLPDQPAKFPKRDRGGDANDEADAMEDLIDKSKKRTF